MAAKQVGARAAQTIQQVIAIGQRDRVHTGQAHRLGRVMGENQWHTALRARKGGIKPCKTM